jgi:uncharacterized protein (DUF3084 family)
MKFTRQNLIQAFHTLNGFSNLKTTAKGAYGIAKNKRLLKNEIYSIQEARNNIKLPEALEEYEKERIALCEELSDKNEDGTTVQATDNQGRPVFKIVEKQKEFQKEMEELGEKYKEALDERQKLEDDFKAFMDEEVDLELHAIKLDDFPNDVSPQQVDALGDILTP